MTVSAGCPTSWTRATGRWQWRHEMSSLVPAIVAIAVPRYQRRHTEMFAPVLRTLVPGRRPVGPHVHGECWPTGGSRPGQRAPPHAEPCRRRVDRARWSLAIVGPETGRCYPPTRRRGRVGPHPRAVRRHRAGCGSHPPRLWGGPRSRRTSVRFVDLSRPEGPVPRGLARASRLELDNSLVSGGRK